MTGYQEFTPVPVPAGLTPGAPGECIRNAIEAALEGGLRYAEGIALDRALGVWYRHAWNADKDGNAIDVTWGEDGARYIGRACQVSRPLALAAYRGVTPTRSACSARAPGGSPIMSAGAGAMAGPRKRRA